MAFLCPAGFSGHKRRRRAKIKNVENNVEGESEVTTDMVTEFEPTKMIVVRDFVPCVDDELEVKRGQHVKALYQENEWRFVVGEDGKEGFIPYTYCIPITEQVRKHESHDNNVSQPGAVQYKLLNDRTNSKDANMNVKSNDNGSQTCDNVFLQEFVKKHHGRYVVLFDYDALQEDDISAGHGEKVTVLNKDDVDWYWIRTHDDREGFIPRQYLQHVQETNNSGNTSGAKQPRHISAVNDVRLTTPATSLTTPATSLTTPATSLTTARNASFEVKKLTVIREFMSRGKHELTVQKGEELFTDDSNIDKQPWIWVYSPQTRKSGFVPNSCLRWSQNTTFL